MFFCCGMLHSYQNSFQNCVYRAERDAEYQALSKSLGMKTFPEAQFYMKQVRKISCMVSFPFQLYTCHIYWKTVEYSETDFLTKHIFFLQFRKKLSNPKHKMKKKIWGGIFWHGILYIAIRNIPTKTTLRQSWSQRGVPILQMVRSYISINLWC